MMMNCSHWNQDKISPSVSCTHCSLSSPCESLWRASAFFLSILYVQEKCDEAPPEPLWKWLALKVFAQVRYHYLHFQTQNGAQSGAAGSWWTMGSTGLWLCCTACQHLSHMHMAAGSSLPCTYFYACFQKSESYIRPETCLITGYKSSKLKA